ncbi:hypothetical protein XAXN_11820 [Xanthomonas axonopodis]|uniref:Uncharacterized protein n=1 Tax=Xanthomonas axonopodis TaxID=53413 RepID=A0A0P6VRH0_9XANT|nr:hypothetical protein XAXN_11820 [Xanthomonas axonopodis]
MWLRWALRYAGRLQVWMAVVRRLCAEAFPGEIFVAIVCAFASRARGATSAVEMKGSCSLPCRASLMPRIALICHCMLAQRWIMVAPAPRAGGCCQVMPAATHA